MTESPISAAVAEIIASGDGITGELRALGALDEARRGVIGRLLRRGFRNRGFVGEYGELLAGELYPASERAPASEPGYDLLARIDDRVVQVQVKTVHDIGAYARNSLGVMRDPYEVLLAIRLDPSFEPVAAIQAPREAVEEFYPPGTRVSWTQRLASHPAVHDISPARLRAAAAHLSERIRRMPPPAEELTEEQAEDILTGNAGVTAVPWTAELALRVLRVTVETPNAEIVRRAREASATGTLPLDAVQALRAVGYDI